MRLKTKFQDKDFELGEVVNARVTTYYAENKVVVKADIADGDDVSRFEYNSIKEFTDHWEDATEEPKKCYEILDTGIVIEYNKEEDNIFRNTLLREIGNYFESEEEANRTVKKLKAWKRVKDKGFRFVSVRTLGKVIDFDIPGFTHKTLSEKLELKDDLDLLFGDGE